MFKFAPVAQLDRASDYGSEGWGFESSRAYQLIFTIHLHSKFPDKFIIPLKITR